LEMASEPEASAMPERVKHKAYPAREAGGFVWTYLGPPAELREFEPPAFAPTPNVRVSATKVRVRCNWAQVLEGQIDSAQSSTLLSPEDDVTTMFYFIAWNGRDKPGVDPETWRKFNVLQWGADVDRNFDGRRTLANLYLQDRAAMKQGNFTGIAGIPTQDIAMWESMGPISDRSQERLGASDVAVAAFRRLMVEAARTMQNGGPAIGTTAPHVSHASIRPDE